MADDERAIAFIKPEYLLQKAEKPYEDGMVLEVDCRSLKKPENIPNLCGKLAKGGVCENTICRYTHDVDEFIQKKPDELPFVCAFGTDCSFGIKCRLTHGPKTSEPLTNLLPPEVQTQLRKKKYDFKISDEYLRNLKIENANQEKQELNNDVENEKNLLDQYIKPTIREEEAYKKKRRHDLFKSGNTYLAPLTTHGHVAFRRLCKHYGADITCGEMSRATSVLQGKNSDWLCFKRHASESNFGIQIAAKHVDVLSRTCEVIRNHCTVDFVDLNLCCPIDSAYERGIGASLLPKKGHLEGMIKAMSTMLKYQKPSHLSMDTSTRDPEEHMPLFSVKMRTGVKDGKNLAHSILPILQDNDFDMASIHGRSREQRYSKLADWEYMNDCRKLCSDMAFFGNGDVTHYSEYEHHMQQGFDGILIARGALIKPWLFEEIKEKRHIDKSATERMEMIKLFMEYGMEHFGSDSVGIEKTRRFFCEWWSFGHRYVPFPILERVPHQINYRPQSFWGRNELETLMSSSNPSDWIRLSEIYLGPSDEKFTFKPKHKANSYK